MLHAARLVLGRGDECRYTYVLRRRTRKGLLLLPTKMPPPNDKCAVCSGSTLHLRVDSTATTLGDVVDKVLKGRLAFNEPSVMVGASGLYEEG